MAIEVKLEILYNDRERSNGVVDIYESQNLPLSIQYGIKNITNLAESQGSYTKTFDVPATKNNNRLLKHAIRDQKVNVTMFVDQSIKARVSVNGRIVLTGAFTIKSYLKDHKDRGYTITILGDNNNWTSVMNGKMMCETIDTELNTPQNWTAGTWNWYNMNRKVDDVNFPSGMPTYDIAIPHICWGKYEYPTAANVNQYVSHHMEQTPAFFIKNLVLAYFTEAGYDLQSDFMNTKFFKKLIMPTDPVRFNHGNYGTLGGGTVQGMVTVAESVFYNDTGHGHPADIYDNLSIWTGTQYAPNWKWLDCDDTIINPDYSSSYGERRVNHCIGLGRVNSPSSGNPAGMWWILERVVPFNEELADMYNAQIVHAHQKCANPNYTDQNAHTFMSLHFGYFGWVGGADFHNVYPIQFHNWVCPTTATYTIDVQLSLGLMRRGVPSSNGRAKVLTQLVMHTGLSGINYTDNTWINSVGTNNGTVTVLADLEVNNGNNDPSYEFMYKEVDITWTGTIPSGAMIYVVCTNVNMPGTDFTGGGILLDRDFTKFCAGAEMHGMTGTTARESKFKITTDTSINDGDVVTWHEYLPCDISQREFISGLTGMFNLHWWTDESLKTVYVEPYETFYKEKAESVDWSGKIDLYGKHETKFLTDILNRYALYRYAEPSKDGYQTTLNKDLLNPYHSALIDLGAQYINKTTEYGTTFFTPTVMIHDNQLVDLITPTPPWIPLIVQEWVVDVETSNKPDKASGYGIRILSYEGLQSTGDQDVEQTWVNNGAGGLHNKYPRAVSFVTNNVVQTGQQHAQLPYHDNPSTNEEGLYSVFYGTMFKDIIELPRMKVAKFHLTPTDIANLDLRKLVYIAEDGGANGTYWKIHKVVDYQPHLDTLTKVELLQFQIKTSSKPVINGGGGDGEPTDDDVTQARVRPQGGKGKFDTAFGNPFTRGNDNTYVIQGNNDSDYPSDTVKGQSLVMKGNIAPKDNGNVVLGNGLIANDTNQIVLGQFNKLTPNATFVIGGGTSNNDRRNVLTVFKDGTTVMGDDSDNLVTEDVNGAYIDLYTEQRVKVYKEDKITVKTIINKVK